MSMVKRKIVNKIGTIKRSVILNAVDYGTKMAAMFLVTPAIIEALGEENYGYWLLIMAVIGYLPLLEAGVSSAGTKFLAAARQSADPLVFGRSLGAIRRFLRISGWIALLVMLLAAAISAFLHHTIGLFHPDAASTFLIFLFPTVLTFWMRDRLLVLRASLRYDLIVATTASLTIIQTTLVLLTLQTTQSLAWLAIAHAVPQTICYIAQHILGGRILRSEQRHATKPGDQEIKELRDISNHVFGSQIAMAVSGKSEPFLASLTAGVSAVPLHGVARRMTHLFSDAFQMIFGQVLTASYSAQSDSTKRPLLLSQLREACFFIGILAGCACSILHFVSAPFFEAWLPPSFSECHLLLNWLLPGLALRLASGPLSSFLLATGGHRLISQLSWILAIMSLTLMTAFGFAQGITGIFIGLGISEVVLFGILFPISLRSRIPQISAFVIKRVIVPIFIGGCFPSLLSLILRELLVPNYFLIVCFAICCGVSISPVLFFLYRKRERERAQNKK